MGKAKTTNLKEGTKIIAPNHSNGSREPGVIVDNLITMYFIKYENETEGFVFKNEHIELIKDAQ